MPAANLAYFFLVLGVIYLLPNVYSDIKRRKIKSKYNNMAMGATIMLLGYLQVYITKILLLIAVSIVIGWFARKLLADGDTEALSWIIISLGAIEPYLMLWFVVMLVLVLAFNIFLRLYLFKSKEAFAGYPAVFGAYLLTLLVPFVGWLSGIA